MSSKPRKKRTVRGSMVDISNIVIPEINYNKYLQCTRSKLYEREINMLSFRINTIRQCFIDGFKMFIKRTKIYSKTDLTVDSAYIHSIINKHALILNNNQLIDNLTHFIFHTWNGVQSTYTSRTQIHCFADYFRLAKNRVDCQKLDILCQFFWIQILNILQKVIYNYVYPCLYFSPLHNYI